MLKLGYFSHTNFSPSETFIYDLVKGLQDEKDLDVTYVSGMCTGLTTDFDVRSIATGYAERHQVTAFRLYKLGQLYKAKGEEWKMRFNQRTALRQLTKAQLPHFDVAYVDYATSGVLVMNYLEQHQIPFIVHVHGYDVTACLNDKAYAKQLKELFKKASHIITPSHHIKRLLVVLGCPIEKETAIYPVTNMQKIKAGSWSNRHKQTPMVTFLGRLTEKKNPLALLHAFYIVSQKLPNVKFCILGDGPLRPVVEERIKELELSGEISLVGSVNRAVAFQYLKDSWIYAQHSVTSINGDQEGFPVSLAEAAAHALPLVSTIHSGITENIIDGTTGFVVQEHNYEAMAEKIIYLLQNPDVAMRMGKAGREHIMQLCEPGERVKKIKELLMLAAQK